MGLTEKKRKGLSKAMHLKGSAQHGKTSWIYIAELVSPSHGEGSGAAGTKAQHLPRCGTYSHSCSRPTVPTEPSAGCLHCWALRGAGRRVRQQDHFCESWKLAENLNVELLSTNLLNTRCRGSWGGYWVCPKELNSKQGKEVGRNHGFTKGLNCTLPTAWFGVTNEKNFRRF